MPCVKKGGLLDAYHPPPLNTTHSSRSLPFLEPLAKKKRQPQLASYRYTNIAAPSAIESDIEADMERKQSSPQPPSETTTPKSFQVVDLGPSTNDEAALDNDNEFTKDGSLNWKGNPALKGNTGGWKCGMVLLVNQGLVTLAFAGVEVNMVLYSKSVLRQTNAEAANTFTRWMATTYLFSLMGAFLSDSYLGRYLTIVTFQIIFIIGLVTLSFSTHKYLLQPPGCGRIGELCEPQRPIGIAMFYLSIYLIALGNGASEPALATFGADQFDEEDPVENESKTSYYSYFYVALNLGSLISETVLVYLENMGYWVLGFSICCGCAVVAQLLFLRRSLKYRHIRASGNPISRLSQVVVAAIRKVNVRVPPNAEELHGVEDGEGEANGTRRILHSNGFRFLDKAATVSPKDMTKEQGRSELIRNPWRLCTVTQVEEVKCVLRLLPIWLCTVMSSMVFIQMLSLFVEQGAAMNRVIFKFQFPPASMTVFDIISTSIFILLYDKVILPAFTKVTKREPNPPSELKRIGFGLGIAIIAMLLAGIVEQQRQRYAVNGGGETSSLSIFWQTPQYVLVGVSEAFVYVAQMEFFASQTPDALKSLGVGLSMSSSAIGSYVCSIILTVVMKITSAHGKPGWVPPNLNQGHLDRFFFISAALTAANLGAFIVCAGRYKGISLEKRDKGQTEES